MYIVITLHRCQTEARAKGGRNGSRDLSPRGLGECGGRSGVTPAAIYRHFTDKEHLRAAISQAAREQLARAISLPRPRTLSKRGAAERFRQICLAYVEFALTEPLLYAAAFEICEPPRPDNPSAWGVLTEALDDLVKAGAMPVSRRSGAEMVAWCAVHGAANLITTTVAGVPSSQRSVVVKQVLDGVKRSLQITP
jgi:AcrR family transcriptional regulator